LAGDDACPAAATVTRTASNDEIMAETGAAVDVLASSVEGHTTIKLKVTLPNTAQNVYAMSGTVAEGAMTFPAAFHVRFINPLPTTRRGTISRAPA